MILLYGDTLLFVKVQNILPRNILIISYMSINSLEGFKAVTVSPECAWSKIGTVQTVDDTQG